MALATRCPYCHTTFRVTHDQLKLRGGLVRCGACKEIFNGVEHLLAAAQQPGTSAPAFTPSTPASAATSAPAVPATAPIRAPGTTPETPDTMAPAASDLKPEPSAPEAAPPAASASSHARPAAETPAATEPEAPESAAPEFEAPQSKARESEARIPPAQAEPDFATRLRFQSPSQLPPTTPEQDIDPLTRMTLMDMRPWPQAETRPGLDEPNADRPRPGLRGDGDEIDRALGELQQKPWRGSGPHAAAAEADEFDALDNEEPDFVRQARLQASRQRRTRVLLGLASVLLALLALLQAAIVMRTDIAARWPATLPVLASLCNLAGCKIGLPQQIEYVSIESHELQSLPNSENGFVLSMLLRNRSKVEQAWPYLELTLNDAAEQPVARRVLAPADYLSAQERARGMQPSSEKPVRVAFTLAQLKASGYRLYVFYP